MHQSEINLGGTMNRVVRIGDTVRREVKGGPILHAYLQYLEVAGMPGVPRFLGLDAQGREILTYLPGKTQEKDRLIGHPCLRSDGTLMDAARLLRRLHDVSTGFLPEALARGWNNPGYPQDTPETICHNDAASWNFVFVNDRIAGLFDFDTACPGTRMWDLTLPVFSLVPILPIEYEPSRDAPERRRRMRLFFEAYGMPCAPDFPALLALRMQDFCNHSTGFGLDWYTRVLAHVIETERDWMIP